MKTKIHGKTYDLTKFKHPGGSIPINLCDGKDGTALFESYHPVSDRQMLNRILEKYEIPNDSTIQSDTIYDYTIFNDDFTKELRTQVYAYFKNLAEKNKCSLITATKMSTEMKITVNVFFLCFLVSTYLYINRTLQGLILFPVSVWFLAINTYHDMSHYAFSHYRLLEYVLSPLQLFLYPPYSWNADHVYTHHSYSNVIPVDTDLQRYIGFYQNIENKSNFISTICEVLFFSDKSIDKYRIKKSDICQTIIYVFMRIIFLKITIYDSLINGLTVYNLIYGLLPILCFAILFLMFTQVNHIHTENFTGCPHFYKHQIMTATNIKTDSYLMRILSGGLNCQIEHHLFPSVNSCHLPEIAKIVKPLCVKYNILYNEYSSFSTALYDTWKTSKKINSKTIGNFNFKINNA
jgi:fatty acid desaturase